jgi:hypothetical protein
VTKNNRHSGLDEELFGPEIEQEAAEKRRQEASYNRFLRKVENVFGTDEGREVAWQLLHICGVHTSTFRKNSESAFLEGRRAVGLDFMKWLGDADYTLLTEILALKYKPPRERDND